MPQAIAESHPWFVKAFDRAYLRIYAHRSDAEAEAQAPRILELLGVRSRARILDLACGAGRHARALARRGMRVTGVDLSRDLLEEARERSPLLPGAPSYMRWDIRRLPFRRQFEGAISMFTSFGYFPSRDDDVAIMEGVARALVPGGRFLLDFLNAAEVRANLVPESRYTLDGLNVHMRRRIDEAREGGPRVVKHVRAEDPRTGLVPIEYQEDVRLYTPDEVDALLEEAGLEPVGDRHGGFAGEPFDDESARLVRVAELPTNAR